MLEELDNINWSQLHHAFGNASAVPIWILALLYEDKQIRDDAIYALSENLQHQGTVYEASLYAVPFLIELLKSSTITDKAATAMLLADMGNNSGGAHHKLLATEGKVSGRNAEKGKRYAESIRLTVRAEIHLLYPYLLHEEWHVRAVIAHALTAFPELSKEIIARLEKALESEDNKDTKETMVNAIRILSEGIE
jgi:hypothetical protein